MREAIIQPILEDSSFQSLVGAAREHKLALAYSMAEPAKPFIARALREALCQPILIITATEQQALRLHSDLTQLIGKSAYLLPPREITFYHAAASSKDTLFRRAETLHAIESGRADIVIASADAAVIRLAPRESFKTFGRTVRVGERIQPGELIRSLIQMGYERVERVEAKGQCALRGGIIDAYPPDATDAIRVEFFDDELDSIRYFSTETQRSHENCQRCEFTPASELLLDDVARERAASNMERALTDALQKRGYALPSDIGRAPLAEPGKAARAGDSLNSIDSFDSAKYSGDSGDLDDFTELPALDEMRAVPAMATRAGTGDSRLAHHISRIADQVRAGAYPAGIEQFILYIYSKTESIFDWASSFVVILDEPDKIRERCEARLEAFRETFKNALERGEALSGQAGLLLDAEEWFAAARRAPSVIMFSSFLRTFAGLRAEALIKMESVGSTGYQGALRDAAADIKRWRTNGWRIALLAGGSARGRRLCESLSEMGVSCELWTDADAALASSKDTFIRAGLRPAAPNEVGLRPTPADLTSAAQGVSARAAAPGRSLGSGVPAVLPLSMAHGFVSAEMKFAALTDADLFGAALRRARQLKRAGERIAAFTDLKIGDYVVHESHGVGMYKGTVRLQSEGHWREYLYIQYQDSDKLYIPTDQMDRVQKYIGGDAAAPRLNRLGGSEWNRQKQKVRQSIRQMAFDLVKLYAQRTAIKGHAFSPDTPWQLQFEEFFPYEETPDQLQAAEEIKRDMESETPMDRLLCGDVGYGKTEVALRAAFKAIMDGKQVAILAPTTVLTQQHFHTIQERFQGFPVRAESISRFKTPAQQKEILKRLELGEIDILVGTHRLLAKDVKFKSLGLLVVDEEQRFGVAHKESIKNLRRAVDVLTLSATPIPRTLHMSMVGIRDMSLLETPPEERYPVQTHVVEYSDGLVRDAILRELSRGGQVYMVYNHVDSIESVFAKLKDTVPEARVAIGHGQMREHMLEDVMLDFYDGRYDVLLCTTIIESGLDVPRANTLIVCEADHFGLAQLYQLRGRVGRSNRVAYAYLTLQPDRAVSETADKRLQAIREFTEFGSGFRIAMRDLEIRGAGNLLGAEQHGFLSAVGYDMYCKLLEQTVRELRGEEGAAADAIETRVEFHVDAYLPSEYVQDEKQRMELYHRIAALENRLARDDLEDELTDRFGDIPEEATTLLDIALLKSYLNKLGVDWIQHKAGQVRMRFSQSARVDPSRLIPALAQADKRLIIEPGSQLTMVLRAVADTGAKALPDALHAIEKLTRVMDGGS